MRVLVTGATGYVGGRLVPRLLEAGHQVRVLVRRERSIAGRPWADGVEVFVGDMVEGELPAAAFGGVDAAYYLVHSMHAGRDFAQRDRSAASRFADAARDVPLTVYLGGLLPSGGGRPSKHLASRAEVGEVLRSRLPTTEFRAGPIIGSGSASFEMVRYLTDRLPVMVAPRWILNEVRPIGIRDILAYLLAALGKPPLGAVDVGVAPMTFKAMMEEYAAVRGYRRLILPLPVLAPTLAALWVGLVTPIPNRIAVPLIQGMIEPLVGDTLRAREIFPDIEPMPYRRAVALAMERIGANLVETRWSGAVGAAGTFELIDWEGLIREVRSVHVAAPPAQVFRAFCSLGGERGWLAWDWAWRVRGAADRLFGGPGLRRGRRHPEELLEGEAVDFWRVERVQPDKLLRLRAEMRVPGKAWLQFEAVPEQGGTRLVQTAFFAPDGVLGALYWYTLYPIHRPIFSDLVRAIARLAAETPCAPRQSGQN